MESNHTAQDIEAKRQAALKYFKSILKNEDMVPADYRAVLDAESVSNVKTILEFLIASYLRVPLEEVEEAMRKKQNQEALRATWMSHVKNRETGLDPEIEKLKKDMRDLQVGIRSIENVMHRQAEQLSGLSAHFQEEAAETLSEDITDSSVPISDSVEPEVEDTPVSDVPAPEESTENAVSTEAEGVKETVRADSQAGPSYITGEIIAYHARLKRNGFSEEQIDFFLECLRDGYSIRQLRKLEHVDIPVSALRRIREINEKKHAKKKKNGRKG